MSDLGGFQFDEVAKDRRSVTLDGVELIYIVNILLQNALLIADLERGLDVFRGVPLLHIRRGPLNGLFIDQVFWALALFSHISYNLDLLVSLIFLVE